MRTSVNVLIIEDNEAHAEIIVRSFEGTADKYNLFIAKSIKEGTEYLSKNNFDLAIVDWRLPDGDGIEFIETNYKLKDEFPIVLMTSQGSEIIAAEAFRKGAYDYIIKNFDTLSDMPHNVDRIIKDFREQKEKLRIEAELNETAGRLTTIIDTVDDFIWSINLKRNGEIINSFFSPVFQKLTGSSVESINDMLQPFSNFVNYEDDERKLNSLRSRILSETQDFYEEELIKLTTKQGTNKWVNIKLNVSYNENGTIKIVGTANDVTDLVKSRETVTKLEKQYETIVENLPDILLRFDNNFVVLYANNTFFRTFELDNAGIIGHSLDTANIPLTIRNIIKSNLTQIYSDYQKIVKDISISTNKGESFFNIRVFSESNDDKSINNFVVIFTDITDRKRAEIETIKAKEEAVEALKLKNGLLANMSHEFRTPLNAILGFTDILVKEIENLEYKNLLEMMNISSNRLLRTLTTVLELSDLQAGKLIIPKEDVDPLPIIEDTIEDFRHLAESKNIVLELIKPQINTKIEANSQNLGKVLDKIVDNAIKFTEKGKITINLDFARVDDNFNCFIKIADTGIGISPEYKDIIFKEFRQVSEGWTRQFEGSGLGLSVAKLLTEKMNGKISVESTPGKGSTFTIKFTAIENAELAHKQQNEYLVNTGNIQSNTLKKEQQLVKPDVLIVEDNYLNFEIAKIYLNDLCNISHADKGIDAITMAKNHKFSLILMDINLGVEMDGVTAMKEIRKDSRYLEIPIIAVTGYAMLGDRERFLSEGFDEYLPKPFSKLQITNIVRELIKEI